jgi:hypothetical protein
MKDVDFKSDFKIKENEIFFVGILEDCLDFNRVQRHGFLIDTEAFFRDVRWLVNTP